MSRLFTFGCSFTKYNWSTWADIIGSTVDHHENWGKPGAGNHYIFNALIECSIRSNINKNDQVAIMWSNVTREDSYSNNNWSTPGNLYSHDGSIIKSDLRGFYIRDLALIHGAKKILDSIGCKYYFTSMVDVANAGDYEKVDAKFYIDDLLKNYQEALSIIRPSVHNVVFNHDWFSRPYLPEINLEKVKNNYQDVAGNDWPSWEEFSNDRLKGFSKKILKEIFDLNRWDWKKSITLSKRHDHHPTPIEHLEYVQKVLPEFIIKEETIESIHQVDSKIRADDKWCDVVKEKSINIKRW